AIERAWRPGDCLQVEFPMGLRFEPIAPAYPNRAALMYGPVMLAMRSNEGGPLSGKIADPAAWIEPVPGEALHFKAKDNRIERLFVPFYEIGEREPYYVYNDILEE
ncbi:MAG: glycoside hydrolase family 127 protein, partial [Kiritimatiellota bacterium]|nr:glycoside hydrolase family 127 protein [Kiritimatiellota bacterium]